MSLTLYDYDYCTAFGLDSCQRAALSLKESPELLASMNLTPERNREHCLNEIEFCLTEMMKPEIINSCRASMLYS